MKYIDAAAYSIVFSGDDGGLKERVLHRVVEAFRGENGVLSVEKDSQGGTIAINVMVRLGKGAVRPDKIVEKALEEIENLEDSDVCFSITRTGLYRESDGSLKSPYQVGAGERLDK